MSTRRHISLRKKTRKMTPKRNGGKIGKKWTTDIDAAQKILKTGLFGASRKSLKKQTLSNARRLFGSVAL